MTSQMHALLAPDTNPDNLTLQELLWFFDQVLSIAPVPTTAGEKSAVTGLHQPFFPPVLHEEGYRLTRLLREMDNHAEDFLAGKLATLAKKDPGSSEERTAVQLSRMIGHFPPVTTSDPSREELFDAALFLGLADLLRRKEEEVRAGLALAAASKRDLILALRGGDEDDDEDQGEITLSDTIISKKVSLSAQLLVRSWCRLTTAGPLPLPGALLTCSDDETLQVFVEHHLKICRREAVPFLSLDIPRTNVPEVGEFQVQRRRFQEEAGLVLASLRNLLLTLQDTGTPKSEKTPAALATAWRQLLQRCCPDAAGWRQLTFYRFPGLDSETLIRGVAGLDRTCLPAPVQSRFTIVTCLSDDA